MTDLPPILRGDSTTGQRVRRANPDRPWGASGIRRPDTRTAVCPHCGRTYEADSWSQDGNSGRVMGFLVTAAIHHAMTCALATPEERRAIARADMRRWATARADRRKAFRPQQQIIGEETMRECPFCGLGGKITGDEHVGFHAGCSACYCEVGEAFDRDAMPDHMFRTEAEAITAWNSRSPVTVTEGLADLLLAATVSVKSLPAPCVYIDYETREEADALVAALLKVTR